MGSVTCKCGYRMSTIGPAYLFDCYVYRVKQFEYIVDVWKKMVNRLEVEYDDDIVLFASHVPWKCLKCGRIWIFDNDIRELIGVFRKSGMSILPNNLHSYTQYRVFSKKDKMKSDDLWEEMERKKYRNNLPNIPPYTWTVFLKNDFTEILAIPRLKDECHKYVLEDDRRSVNPRVKFEF